MLLRKVLYRVHAARVCLVGVGNRQLGDDGAGPRIVSQIAAAMDDSSQRSVSLSEKGSAPLEAAPIHWDFDAAGEGPIPFRAGSVRLCLAIDVGVTPENFLEPIVRSRPDLLLLFDAVDFGGLPGECRLIEASSINATSLSTHAASLAIVFEYLAARGCVEAYLLGIQPQRFDLGEQLSPRVANAVQQLVSSMLELLC